MTKTAGVFTEYGSERSLRNECPASGYSLMSWSTPRASKARSSPHSPASRPGCARPGPCPSVVNDHNPRPRPRARRCRQIGGHLSASTRDNYLGHHVSSQPGTRRSEHMPKGPDRRFRDAQNAQARRSRQRAGFGVKRSPSVRDIPARSLAVAIADQAWSHLSGLCQVDAHDPVAGGGQHGCGRAHGGADANGQRRGPLIPAPDRKRAGCL